MKVPVTKSAPLGDLVDQFKGKAVSAHLPEGQIKVINIADISESGQIDYNHLKGYDLTDKAIKRYILEDGDVLIASKGTVKKIAVFDKQTEQVIASSNLTVLRPGDQVRGYYIKLFLETAEGQKLLDRANHGKTVLNISTRDLLSIEIPMIPIVKQDYQIATYLRAREEYDRKLSRAQQEWNRVQDQVNRNLFR